MDCKQTNPCILKYTVLYGFQDRFSNPYYKWEYRLWKFLLYDMTYSVQMAMINLHDLILINLIKRGASASLGLWVPASSPFVSKGEDWRSTLQNHSKPWFVNTWWLAQNIVSDQTRIPYHGVMKQKTAVCCNLEVEYSYFLSLCVKESASPRFISITTNDNLFLCLNAAIMKSIWFYRGAHLLWHCKGLPSGLIVWP